MGGLSGQRCLAIEPDSDGVAQRLCDRLRGQGVPAIVAPKPVEDATGLILLGGLRRVADVAEATAIQRGAFLRVQHLARTRKGESPLLVTVQDSGGCFGRTLSQVNWLSGLSGLAKTFALEHPEASAKAIDIEAAGLGADQIAERIFAEMTRGGRESEVGLLANGERLVPLLERAPLPSTESGPGRPAATPVLVVSGGGRGITAACLSALARRMPARFALLGRTPLIEEPDFCRPFADEISLKRALTEQARRSEGGIDWHGISGQARRILSSREVRGVLDDLTRTGSQAWYFPVDVRDRAALGEALGQVRKKWGPVTGLIHGAGVVADKLIADKSVEQFDLVFETKVSGLACLLEALRDDPLTDLFFFSSVAAHFGNPGQCDYAMANEVLNRVAWPERRRRQGRCRVKSLLWGPWEAGMVKPALKSVLEKKGVRLLSVQQGSALFVKEFLDGAADEVEVVLAGATADKVKATGQDRDLELYVDLPAFPFLADHAVKTRPVVPAAMILEWMLQGAREAGALRPSSCRHLKILRGIELPSSGERLLLSCRGGGRSGIIRCDLFSHDKKVLHASAEVAWGPQPSAGFGQAGNPGVQGWPCSIETVYRDVLFHGPQFQLIEALEAFDETGGSAFLIPAHRKGWSGGPWICDPALLDGGLQLAGAWGGWRKKRLALPMALGRWECFAAAASRGAERVRCIAHCAFQGQNAMVAQLRWEFEDGRPIARVRDAEFFFLEWGKDRGLNV